MNNPVIEKLVPGGQGIATLPSGIKGFFWNALPGETVLEYRITKKKSKYFEAVAEKISEPSKRRISPRDHCFLSTSPWQIMGYAYELDQKRELLIEIFRQNGLENFFEGPKTWPSGPERPEKNVFQTVLSDNVDFNYRNKMEYSLYYDKDLEKIFPAFHQRGAHRKIPIEKSSIERPEIFKKALEIIADLNARGEEARKYQSLVLRCDQSGKVSGGLYENGKPHPVFDNLTDEILGHEYSYSPNGFFQINLPVYEMALEEIKKHITTEKVLDLYAGVGTIGLSVARDRELKLVEVDKAAYAELERNAKNAETFLSKSEEALDFIAPDQTVIVDPPRAGCDEKLIAKLNETKPEKIIYLSCNPATQARDVKVLLENYKIEKMTPYNFFPRTPHLENLVILARK